MSAFMSRRVETTHKIHLSNTVLINSSQVVATFSRDQDAHESTKMKFLDQGFFTFSHVEHDVVAEMGSKVAITIECKQPKQCNVEAISSTSFAVDEYFFEKGSHSIYFDLDPEPSEECDKIKLIYRCEVDGVENHALPLRKDWPPGESKPVVTTTKRKGGVTTTFNAPVGQIAAGGTIVNRGKVNNYVAGNGSHQVVDQSVTAGSIFYGPARIRHHDPK